MKDNKLKDNNLKDNELKDKNLAVDIAGVQFKNPILAAAGTFGNGRGHSYLFDINILGGIVTPGISHKPWPGNPPVRIAETYGGMLSSIGLQNPGAKVFIEEDLPFMRKTLKNTKIIVNLCGRTVEEYIAVTKDFENVKGIDLFELNLSMSFATDPKLVELVVSAVKVSVKTPLIVKLNPHITDIVTIARAAEAGGADALSLINTIPGMKIDIYNKKPLLSGIMGGLSGPAIKPIALGMVYQVTKQVSLPVIGIGGIMTGEDAIEFIMAGATAVGIGTANLVNPTATAEILEEIEAFMTEQKIGDINGIRGIV